MGPNETRHHFPALFQIAINHFDPVRIRSAAAPVRRVIEVLGLAERLGLDGA